MSFASLSDLKNYLGMSTVVTADAELTRLLGMADTMIETFIERSLASAPRVERRSGYGSDVLLVKDGPITAVSLLKISDVAIVASDGSTAGYLIDGNKILLIGGQRFTCGRKNIIINYTGGYTTIPADIVHSAIEIAAQAYREREWIGATSKSLAGETTAFARGFMPDSAKQTLQLYRRMHDCD